MARADMQWCLSRAFLSNQVVLTPNTVINYLIEYRKFVSPAPMPVAYTRIFFHLGRVIYMRGLMVTQLP